MKDSENVLSENLRRREDFPTPEFPMTNRLKRCLKSFPDLCALEVFLLIFSDDFFGFSFLLVLQFPFWFNVFF